MSRTLEIRTHEEACIIANALNDYCTRMADEVQCFVKKALEEGNREDADRFIKLRDSYRNAQAYYADYPYGKLQDLILRWEWEAHE